MKSIIIDLGSSSIKLGFNNEDNPKYELPSYIGETSEQIIDGKIIKNENKRYISSSCDEIINNLKLYYPIQNGIFKNPDDINLIFGYLLKKLELNSVQDISSCNILLTEPLLSNNKNKKNISEFLFEKMNIFWFSTYIIYFRYRAYNRSYIRIRRYDDSNLRNSRRVSNS